MLIYISYFVFLFVYVNPSWVTLCLYMSWVTGGGGGVFFTPFPPSGNDTSALCRMLIYDRWAYRMNMK